MGKVERIIIYTLLAVLAVITFTDLGPTQAEDKAGEAPKIPEGFVLEEPPQALFKKITIVDKEGKARIKLGVDTDDSPLIGLIDQNGKIRMELGVRPFVGPSLSFYDQNGKTRMDLWLFPLYGGVMLDLRDQNEKLRMKLKVAPDGSPSIELYDQDGKQRAVLGSTDLEVTKTGTQIKKSPASLVLFGKEGKVIWEAP